MSDFNKDHIDNLGVPQYNNDGRAADEDYTESETEAYVGGLGTYRLENITSNTLVIHCGDPRFQTAFHDFIRAGLGISNYTPLIIGGGIHAFGMQTFLPKNFKIIWEQIKFFVKEGELDQIIIINHEDCKWYEKMKGYYGNISLPLKGKKDLKQAALKILQDFSGVSVRTFWAGLDGDNIVFTEIK